MATGWAREGAVQEQIDATIKDAIERAKQGLPAGPSLTNCAHCGETIPEARRAALPGVRLCLTCQSVSEGS
jgi:phage/conjugal plasmid C-4 type zinc finger TraR family protein